MNTSPLLLLRNVLLLALGATHAQEAAVANTTATYVIAASSFIRSDMEYRVIVSILPNVKEDVNIKLELHQNKTETNDSDVVASQELSVAPGNTVLMSLQLQQLQQLTFGDYFLRVGGSSPTMNFSNECLLAFNDKEHSVFIQTDKAIYKPGDKVKFRIVAVNFKLLPVARRVNVVILDPKKNQIKQWRNHSLERGVTTFEMELAYRPVLGVWMIEADVEKLQFKEFTVGDYDLPKYEVIVTLPPYYSGSEFDVMGTIEAKYTSEKVIQGSMNITVSVIEYPDIRMMIQQDDKKDFVHSTMKKIENGKLLEIYLPNFAYEGEAKAPVHEKGLRLEFFGPLYFKIGFPYTAYLKVKKRDGSPLSSSDSKEVQIKKAVWGSDYETFFYEVPDSGVVSATLQTDVNDTGIHLSATHPDADEAEYFVGPFMSRSKQFLRLSADSSRFTVGETLTVYVNSTVPMSVVSYQVTCKGNIVKGGKLEALNQSTLTLQEEVTPEMAPKSHVTVFYVHDGELLVDGIKFEVDGVFKNKITVNFDVPNAQPGNIVTVQIDTDPNSFVGLLAVDPSARLVLPGNDITQQQVITDLNARWNKYPMREHYEPEGDGDFPWMTNIGTSSDVVKHAGLVVLTNAFIYNQQENMTIKRRNAAEVDEGLVQNIFPESWLWINTSTPADSGRITVNAVVPDGIDTSWLATGFSINEDNGLAITEQATTLTVLRPFFVSLNLPYSMIQGEELDLQALVFNNMEEDAEANVTLIESRHFLVPTKSEEKQNVSQSINKTVKAGQSETFIFPIVPGYVGIKRIKVLAQMHGTVDEAETLLFVKAEGVQRFGSENLMIESTTDVEANRNVEVKWPNDFSQRSRQLAVSVTGDMMGSTIHNMENLLNLPYGCGEQNMMSFASSIFIINYLLAMEQLTSDIKDRALRSMERGYQQELAYQRTDGSFSAFGEKDDRGSMWLTAFVAKSFNQARSYIYIDQFVIEKALGWIVKWQRDDGQFPEPGQVLYKPMQVAADSGSTSLTAYVLISLLENKENISNQGIKDSVLTSISKAQEYLESNLNSFANDSYSLAVTTYALTLAESGKADKALELLNKLADEEDGMKHWSMNDEHLHSSRESCYPVETEMTSYALLTLTKRGELEAGVPIMQWLKKRQNPLGGFTSTQDTVIGLQALFEFSEKRSQIKDVSFKCMAKAQHVAYEFNVNKSNMFAYQTAGFPISYSVAVRSQGIGICNLQIKWMCNIKAIPTLPSFKLEPEVVQDMGSNIQVQVCVRYQKKDKVSSGMAVVCMHLPSGYVADTTKVKKILASELNRKSADFPYELQRIETVAGDTIVNMYYNRITINRTCITVDAFKAFNVKLTKPAVVRVFDYYAPDDEAVKFYTLGADVLPGTDPDIPQPTTMMNKSSSYIITASDIVRSNMIYNVSVTVLPEAKGNISIRLRICSNQQPADESSDVNDVASSHVTVEPGSSVIVSLQLGELTSSSGQYLLRASSDNDSSIHLQKEARLGLSTRTFSLFVQTDKTIYKPGQIVHFRVISITAELYPVTGKVDVAIVDPEECQMKQWKSLQLEFGVVSLDMELSDQAVLGEWKIQVDLADEFVDKSFTVDEFVLPRFELKLKLPPYYVGRKFIAQGSVEAKYISGKAVKGNLTVVIKTPSPWQHAEPNVKSVNKLINKEADFSMDTELDRLLSFPQRITVIAEVTEILTGLKVKDEISIAVYGENVKLKFFGSDFFKPGLKYTAYLRVSYQDDRLLQPATSSRVGIRVDFNTALSGKFPEYEIPNDGLVPITVYPTANASMIRITAKHESAKELMRFIKRCPSISDSYMQLSTERTLITPGEIVTLHVNSTVPVYILNYQLVSKGSIVKTGTVNMMNTMTTRFHIEIEPRVNPTAHLVAYFVNNGEVIADGLQFDVNGFQNEVTVTFEPSHEAQPGKEVKVRIDTNPNSFVGLLAVDKSTESLLYRHDLKRMQIKKELSQYSTPDNCQAKYSEPINLNALPSHFARASAPGRLPVRFPSGGPGFVPGSAARFMPVMLPSGGSGLAPGPIAGPLPIELSNGKPIMPGRAVRSINEPSPGRAPGFAAGPSPVKLPGGGSAILGHGGLAALLGLEGQDPPDTEKSVTADGKAAEVKDENIDRLSTDELDQVSPDPANRLPKRCMRSEPLPERFGKFSGYHNPGNTGSVIVDAGLVVLTDAYVLGDGGMFGFGEGGAHPVEREKAFHFGSSLLDEELSKLGMSGLRKLFTETWLWINTSTPSDSRYAVIGTRLPEKFDTSWVATAFSLNKESGLGISRIPATLTASPSFFVSLYLPYSIIRGETLDVQAVVINYMKTDEDVAVTVSGSGAIMAKKGETRKQTKMVKSGEQTTFVFSMRFENVGSVAVSVSAKATSAEAQDMKFILIKDEGIPRYHTHNILIQSTDESDVQEFVAAFSFPPSAVDGSQQFDVAITGDVMGSTISNLGNLLRLPLGCGEQNMLNFASNLFVANYLLETNQLTAELKNKTVQFMEMGYQRELTYRWKDGSFGTFGDADMSGSLWLTAYVAKSFVQAKKYIYVDDKILTQALKWIVRQQDENTGQFREPGTISHKQMQSGTADGLSLTAYTLIALLENKENLTDHNPELKTSVLSSISKAQEYLESNLNSFANDSYSLAVTTYALTLAESGKADESLGLLNGLAVEKDNQKYWLKHHVRETKTPTDQATRSTVNNEIAGYALLTMVKRNDLNGGYPIMRWLTKQFNSFGGFASTQDTVISLQSLSEFAALFYSARDKELNISLVTSDVSSRYFISSKNSLTYWSAEYAFVEESVIVRARGPGIALVQVKWSYNEIIQMRQKHPGIFEVDTSESPAFLIQSTVEFNETVLVVNVCVTYQKPDSLASCMSVTELRLPSGYVTANRKRKLLDKEDKIGMDLRYFKTAHEMAGLQLVEPVEGGTMIYLYYNSMRRSRTCTKVEAYNAFQVTDLKPAYVRVFDYYNPVDEAVLSYNLPANLAEKPTNITNTTVLSEKPTDKTITTVLPEKPTDKTITTVLPEKPTDKTTTTVLSHEVSKSQQPDFETVSSDELLTTLSIQTHEEVASYSTKGEPTEKTFKSEPSEKATTYEVTEKTATERSATSRRDELVFSKFSQANGTTTSAPWESDIPKGDINEDDRTGPPKQGEVKGAGSTFAICISQSSVIVIVVVQLLTVKAISR